LAQLVVLSDQSLSVLSFQARLFLYPGMAPVLAPLRQSSEHILIVRAPGARDQHGCHSTAFTAYVQRGPSEAARCASKKPRLSVILFTPFRGVA